MTLSIGQASEAARSRIEHAAFAREVAERTRARNLRDLQGRRPAARQPPAAAPAGPAGVTMRPAVHRSVHRRVVPPARPPPRRREVPT